MTGPYHAILVRW